MGTGFAATRDIAAFLQHDAKDHAGNANPLVGGIRTAIIQGASQSGNFIRTFLLLGFNQDEEGRTRLQRRPSAYRGARTGHQCPLRHRRGIPPPAILAAKAC